VLDLGAALARIAAALARIAAALARIAAALQFPVMLASLGALLLCEWERGRFLAESWRRSRAGAGRRRASSPAASPTPADRELWAQHRQKKRS
jgi:hypothetical protein